MAQQDGELVIGDDFPEGALIGEIRNRIAEWHGALVDNVSISIGYASRSEYPDDDIRTLEKISDRRMYDDKARYYREAGKK